MRIKHDFLRDIILILISSLGGFLLSLTGMTIGWMVGTMAAAACLSLFQPAPLKQAISQKGIHKGWLSFGQMLLGIELGQKMNMSVIFIFKENWLIIGVMLILSVIFALLSGFVLWRFSNADMLTSFVGTAPGGLSAMPGVAQEVGANTAIVSLVQMIRVLLVVMTIPFFVVFIHSQYPESQSATHQMLAAGTSEFGTAYIAWTAVIVLAVFGLQGDCIIALSSALAARKHGWRRRHSNRRQFVVRPQPDCMVAPRIFGAVANLPWCNDRLKNQ